MLTIFYHDEGKCPLDVERRPHAGASQMRVAFGADITLFMSAGRAERLESALRNIRESIASDPELVESLDVVRMTAEAQRWTAWPVGEYLIEHGWRLSHATVNAGYFRAPDDKYCALVKADGWSILDGGGATCDTGVTIAKLGHALAYLEATC